MLVEHVRDYAIFLLDPEGRVVTWNHRRRSVSRDTGATGDHRPHFSCFYPPKRWPSQWPQRELEMRGRRGPLRRRGLAASQGRHAFLGQCRDHRDLQLQRRAAGLLQSHAGHDASARARAGGPRELNEQLTLRVQQLAETNRTLLGKEPRERDVRVQRLARRARAARQPAGIQPGSTALLRRPDRGAGERAAFRRQSLERARQIVNDDMAESIAIPADGGGAPEQYHRRAAAAIAPRPGCLPERARWT